MIGETVSRYRILEKLGGGGMGVVYKAEDTRLKRHVALKFLSPDLTRDDDAKQRFILEAQAASALDHPNICTIHEIDETPDGRLFIAMACYEGETLKQRLERGPLPADESVDIAIQAAEGLACAHQSGIVHRDIKPANLLLTSRGELKILDFGIAKLSGQDGVTRTGTTVGTAAYMAPEQVAGGDVDQRTDIWALGVVLYEMLAGERPFQRPDEFSIFSAILNDEPRPITTLRSDVPADIARIAHRTLQKRQESRYQSASELLADLRQYRDAPSSSVAGESVRNVRAGSLRRPAIAISIITIGIAIGIGLWSSMTRAGRVRWAREEVIPQIEMHAEAGEWEAAYALAKKVQQVAPDDPALAELWPRFSWLITIPSDPPGAKVFRRAYSAGGDKWEELGTTPLERVRFPFGYSLVRFELGGHPPLLRALGFTVEGSQELMRLDSFKLETDESLPDGMVRVPARQEIARAVGVPPEFRDFFLGRYEVTNREYKAFVDAGGYQRRELWEHPFVQNGQAIPWEKAMALFTDKTGRPGPSTWEAGDYPEGQGDYPVGGVSWYEAAAYARFVGEELPTVHHWRHAFTRPGLAQTAWILPASNLEANGPAPVGQFQGISWPGTYDMAGNVREWCFNATGDKRFILGGGWTDEAAFNSAAGWESYAQPPLDRSAANGFRLAITRDEPVVAARMRLPLPESAARNIATEKPASNEAFEIYRSMYAYDPTPLNAKVEATDSTRNWIRERVSFDTAYGGERMILYLYLPRTASPPYQTVLYYPGGVAFNVDSIDEYRTIHVDFVLKSGRAVAFPVYKGTFERRDKTPLSGPNAFRQRRIQITNDLRRSIDYLATRKDIDSDRFSYYGYSTGGAFAPINLVMEPRLRAAVLYMAGLYPERRLPEVEPVTFLPRVHISVVMLSGQLDDGFPLETSARPFFQLLGTPDERKRHVIAEGGHFVPRPILIRETLDWLDRYLGPVK